MRFARHAVLFLLVSWLPVSLALAAGPQVTIDASYKHEKKFMHSIGVTVTNIVGKKPYRGGFWDTTPATWPVGKHRFGLNVVVFSGLLSGKGNARAEVVATLAPGRKYKAVGSNDGKKVQVWIIDMGSNKRVSTIAKVTDISWCNPQWC